MRNEGPASFSYTPLKIINPFRSEVVVHAGADQTSIRLSRISYQEGGLDCGTSSPVYGTGDEVNLLLAGTLPAYLDQLRLCVTVVPVGPSILPGDST